MNSNFSTAIIMSTYNGEKFIKDQLASLMNQKLVPTHVYIRDDGSRDGTLNIVTEFIRENNLNNWSLISNKYNVGWRKNFMQLLHDTTEDVVFFADQDDIWKDDKIQSVVKYINDYPEIMVLISDYALFGEKGGDDKIRPINETFISDTLSKVNLTIDNLLLKRDGMSMAIRKEIIPKIMHVYNNVDHDVFGFDQAHDSATWIASLLTGGLFHTNERLVNHRIHSSSTWAIEEKKINTSVLQQNENILYFYNKIKYVNHNDEFNKELSKKIDDLKVENSLLKSPSYMAWLLSFNKFSSIKRYLGFLKRNINK